MPLLIENVTELPRPDDRPHDYILRVNRRPLAKFQAVRSLGYAACLRAAADALDKAALKSTAAPSADKLRIAVEALEPFANLGVTSGPNDEPCHYAYRITRGAIRNARQALAALKAEAK